MILQICQCSMCLLGCYVNYIYVLVSSSSSIQCVLPSKHTSSNSKTQIKSNCNLYIITLEPSNSISRYPNNFHSKQSININLTICSVLDINHVTVSRRITTSCCSEWFPLYFSFLIRPVYHHLPIVWFNTIFFLLNSNVFLV